MGVKKIFCIENNNTNNRKKQEIQSVAPVFYLQCDIHITPLAFNVVSIEHFRIPTFQDTALTTSLAIVQAFPGIEHIGLTLFFSGVIYLWWLHGFFKLNDSHPNHPIPFILKDAVGFLNLTQRKTMSDEWSGVNLSCEAPPRNRIHPRHRS